MHQYLRVFVKVAQLNSFTRAAEELHMTQPAVSQYIKTLEQIIGAQLLERNNKFVRLTKAGEIVYQHAREILGLYTRMQSMVEDIMHVASGPLSIGASYTFGEYVLPTVIAQLTKQYPLIKPSIIIGNTAEIAQSVSNRVLDVGIVEGECNHDRLRTYSFAVDWMYIIASSDHPLAHKDKITLMDLKRENWIIRETGSGTREATEKMFKILGFYPERLMEFGSTQIIKESVEAGLGISFLSFWSFRKEQTLGTIKPLKVEGTPISRKFYWIIQNTSFQTKAVEVFIHELKNMGKICLSTSMPSNVQPPNKLKKVPLCLRCNR